MHRIANSKGTMSDLAIWDGRRAAHLPILRWAHVLEDAEKIYFTDFNFLSISLLYFNN